MKRKIGLKPWHYPLFSFLAVLLLLTGCAAVPYTGRTQLVLLPDDQVLQMSLESYQKVLSESEISGDPEATALVKRVGVRIASAAEDFLREKGYGYKVKNFNWEFALIEDDEMVNAWCMPGGKIAVYTGILPYTQTKNGLAVVMGHEVAHALANHGNERMSQLLLAELGAVALAEALNDEPETTQLLWFSAYGLGAQVGVLLPYSRTHEYEADKIGLILTAKAGYDPRESIPFWRRMMEGGGETPPEFLSTHPATEKRIESIKELMPEALQYYKPSPNPPGVLE